MEFGSYKLHYGKATMDSGIKDNRILISDSE